MVYRKRVEKQKFEANDDNKKYKIEDVYNNLVYIRESKLSYLLGYYYWVS